MTTTHFLGRQLWNFSSSKWPLDICSDLNVRCVFTTPLKVYQYLLETTRILAARSKFSLKKKCIGNSTQKNTPVVRFSVIACVVGEHPPEGTTESSHFSWPGGRLRKVRLQFTILFDMKPYLRHLKQKYLLFSDLTPSHIVDSHL